MFEIQLVLLNYPFLTIGKTQLIQMVVIKYLFISFITRGETFDSLLYQYRILLNFRQNLKKQGC